MVKLIEGRLKNSTIDHIYMTDVTKIVSLNLKTTIFGDHKLILLTIATKPDRENFELKRRSWRTYSKELLVKKLQRVEWETEIDSVQSLWNRFEQELVTVIDKIAPMVLTSSLSKTTVPHLLKKQQNRRNYLLKKRRRQDQTEEEKQEIRNLSR